MLEKCVMKELSRRRHGKKYFYMKIDYSDFAYANFCDKKEDLLDCSDFLNGTDPFTGNQTSEVLSIKRKLYMKRVNIYRGKDKKGVFRQNLIFFEDAVYGVASSECGEVLKACAAGHDSITLDQMAAVLCYVKSGITPLPWTFKKSRTENKFEMSFGAGGVTRIIDRNSEWKVLHGPAHIAVNSMICYKVPNGGRNVPLTRLDAIAIDDLSHTIQRKGWREKWCRGKDDNYYLGLDWMKNSLCSTSIEIVGERIKGGPRWYESPGEFVQEGVQGIKQAASAVVNFISKDMWSGLIHFLINTGWYLLYGGLALLGLVLLFIILKCSCAALGMRICSKATEKGDELSVLEKLLDIQGKKQRWFKQRRSVSEYPLL